MSADDNAPEQAREVEVVARAIGHKAACYSADPVAPHPCLCWPWRLKEAEVVLRALAPIRAAERQEAARGAREEALVPMRELADWWHRTGAGESSGYDLACRDHARQIHEEIGDTIPAGTTDREQQETT